MGQIAANLAFLALQDSNKGILRNLQVDGEVLGNIHEEFVKIALQRKIGVHSFQESRGMTGIKGLSGKVRCVTLVFRFARPIFLWAKGANQHPKT